MKYILNNDNLEVVGKQYLNGVGNYTGDTTNASDLATVINDKANKADIPAAALKYCGFTTTKLTDGATTNPVVIDGKNHTAEAGCVVFYEDTEGGKASTKEFVFNGTKWELLGADLTYKVVQSAKSSPSVSGSTTAFIDSISQDAVIYVPCTSLETYKSAQGWSSFSDQLIPYDFENGYVCGGESHYVDEYGRDVRNYTDKNGKQHGRSKADQKSLTHFRILKKEEME
jgi:hypothetical protein